MKLTCLQCDHTFEGSISKDELGWHSSCPVCEGSFDVDVPEGNIVMAFTDKVDDAEDPYRYFTDSFTGEGIFHYFAYDTPEEFVAAWNEISNNPPGMWYFVLVEGRCICSGACDPGDIDIFSDYWDKDFSEL